MTVRELIEIYTTELNGINAKLDNIEVLIEHSIEVKDDLALASFYQERHNQRAHRARVFFFIQDLKNLNN